MTHEPLLTADEERELAARVAAGDADARRRMIEANRGLVLMIAGDFRRRGLEFDDVVGEGMVGLIKAVDRFRPVVGARFSTYAVYWIRQAIREAIVNRKAMIRVPANLELILSRYRAAVRAIYRETGRNATFDEVADRLELTNMKRKLVRQAMKVGRRSTSYGRAALGDDRTEAAVDDADEWAFLLRRLDRLDGRERALVTRTFGLGGEPEPLEQIACSFGITRKWAHDLLVRAIEKLGDASDADAA